MGRSELDGLIRLLATVHPLRALIRSPLFSPLVSSPPCPLPCLSQPFKPLRLCLCIIIQRPNTLHQATQPPIYPSPPLAPSTTMVDLSIPQPRLAPALFPNRSLPRNQSRPVAIVDDTFYVSPYTLLRDALSFPPSVHPQASSPRKSQAPPDTLCSPRGHRSL